MRRAYKYRLFPTKGQAERLQQTLDLCRELYNAALEERRIAWRQKAVSVSYYDQAMQLPAIKESRPDVSEAHSQVLQDVLRRLDKTYKSFFRRVRTGQKAGFPRFKGFNRYDSFTYPQYLSGVRLRDKRIYLFKIGGVKIKLHRDHNSALEILRLGRSLQAQSPALAGFA